MNNLFIIQIILISVVIFSFVLRAIGQTQTGQILLAFGLIDLLIGLAAWRGWKILRGDIAENVPLDQHDTGEEPFNDYGPGADRPTSSFAIKIAGFGIASAIAGLALIWLTSLST